MPYTIPLTEWHRRHENDPPDLWHPAMVPGAWECDGIAFDDAGPYWFRSRFTMPDLPPGARLWLRCAAVSYHCRVFLNTIALGEHTGMWDPFHIELPVLPAGSPAELVLCIEKPASLRAGPDSAAMPGRFPLRETLAGFLPYVWGHAFGGIWQPAELLVSGATVIEDLWLHSDADGTLHAEALLSGPAEVQFTISDPAGRHVVTLHATGRPVDLDPEERSWSAIPVAVPDASHDPTTPPGVAYSAWLATVSTPLATPHNWSPADPARYTAVAALPDDPATAATEVSCRFGVRHIAIDGTHPHLNDQAISPRMALSWGWSPATLAPNPPREAIYRTMHQLRALGYNGIKLCLWVPPDEYLDIADELGMLIWLELPLWLPHVIAALRRQIAIEYPRIMRRVRNHPSLVITSLGCELNRAVGPDILAPLYQRVKQLSGGLPLRDNSGSGAAYGGLLDEYADYRDYHFYAKPHMLRSLIEHFSPAWHPPQPWLFGEFCDYDTLPAPAADHQPPGTQPWWLATDPTLNPQGARWQYDIQHHAERLAINGMAERTAEVRRLSEQQGMIHRKLTLEITRSYPHISGYVVTGEADTPISSAGMWDAAGRLKFAADEFQCFNADLVALVGWESRRDWVAGGDRPARFDPWSCVAGAALRARLIAANHSSSSGPTTVAWRAVSGDQLLGSAEHPGPPIAAGSVGQVATAEWYAPTGSLPQRIDLTCRITIGTVTAENHWPIWCFPHNTLAGMAARLFDPAGRLHDLQHSAAQLRPVVGELHDLATDQPLISTHWDHRIAEFVARGGRAIVLIGSNENPPIVTVALPFWRECVRIVEPHPAWGDFPHEGCAGLQFAACATDRALVLHEGMRPILQRLDTRTMQIHHYAGELPIGNGSALISTLRFEGGHGDQPSGLTRSPAATYLLRCWAAYLWSML